MGKIKTKYPLEIEIDFMLFLQTSELIRDSYLIALQSGNLEFDQIKEVFEQFMSNHQIGYEAYMFFQSVHSETEQLINIDWSLSVNEIEDNNRYIIIKVKSHTQHLKELLYEQISEVSERLSKLQEKLASQSSKEESQIRSPTLMLHHASSISQVSIPTDKDLDIGVLFSQPIFDKQKHKEANMPVDFRSELQRLYGALNNSYKPEITVECQIATKQHLKHLIAYKKPKILHIICHGSKEGELQFQDDSIYEIGALSMISSEKIKSILEQNKDAMPNLVFINSCHSEVIGKIFYEAGAKYCIMIDSQDKIDDEAAQIFSENFYRNIFRGEKVGTAFRQAQDTVKYKQSSYGCCCRHTARQKHKQNCRWLQIIQTMGEYQAHKIYHIPSQKCVCVLRSINQHDLKCEWAQFVLFHINNDFRIKEGELQRFPKKSSELPKYLPSENKKTMLLICCCFNFVEEDKIQNKCDFRVPHSQSNKFKMLPANAENSQSLYQLQKNVSFRSQIFDYSAPQLIQYYEKVQNSSVMGRQQELYEFMNKVNDNKSSYSYFFLYGHSGIGKTTFAIKASTYLIERRVFEIYFFVDLYGIKDKEMFRNKFNQVTKLDYPFNKNSFLQIKTKKMIIVFDNVDQLLLASVEQFQEQLQNLKKEFFHAKFISTCKQKNISVLQNEPILMNNHSMRKELKMLDGNTAAKALFLKIRNYLDISISFLDIREIVANKPELQIPKIIENLSHSFSNTKGKMKLDALKQKVSEIGQGDLAFNKLVEENLNNLKTRSKMSYEMLIFISQFSQGIDKNDFVILGSYDRNENKADNFGATLIDIPIDKNWKKILANLFQKQKRATQSQSERELLQSSISLQKHHTTIQQEEAHHIVEDQNMFEGESYFLQELSRNRFIVKRFIRDFIWNKDKSQQNYYMKHIFVAYTAVMLDIYLNFLVSQNYIHEELLEYSDISQCGIFKFKDNNYRRPLLTQSIRYVEDYNSKFEKILKQQPALREKIRNSDPSEFIMHHKLDFLHIYGYDWTKVYQYLYQNKKREANILFNYLQRLIILIPTAMKVANMEKTLIKYAIRQSNQLLLQIRRFTKPAHTLILTLKLKLMKATSEIEKDGDVFLPDMDFQKEYHKIDLEGIDSDTLKSIQKQWGFQNQLLTMHLHYLKIKRLAQSSENPMKVAQRLMEQIRCLQQLNSDSNFQQECQCELLVAKRSLLQAMIYNKILEVSIKYPNNFKIASFKNNTNLTTLIKSALKAAQLFQYHKMMKLSFRAKLLAVSINWESLKNRVQKHQVSKELQRQRTLLRQCEQMYENKSNNLIGLTIFDGVMKKIRKEMKEKMWQESANNLVMMKAVPLSSKNTPLLQHVVRNKQQYKRELQSIFVNAEIDLSIKFQILNAERLEEETKRQSTILLLVTSFRVVAGKVFLICEDEDLKQKDIEINAQFYQKYPLYNTKLLILMGANATQGFKKLTNLFPRGPSMIAITSCSTSQFDQFQQFNYEDLSNKNVATQLKKIIEHNIMVQESQIQFTKAFIKSMINIKNYQKGIKDIYAELLHQNKRNFQNFKIQLRENSKDVIQMIKGSFKDLSPSFRKTHNIDYGLKDNGGNCVYRKWKQINEVFKQFSSKKESKYIQICGSNGVGKTTFIQEIGRMCIQRNFFERGVYIINGKEVEEKSQSDFESYIVKAAQNSNMFTLQSFNKYANSNFLLIIDDFHLIKPRSNGRYNFFLKKILQKKVNIIFVTRQNFDMRSLLPSISIKHVKIQKLKEVQLDVFAYHVFRVQNKLAIQQYEKQKAKRPLSCPEIVKIHERYLQPKFNNYVSLPDEKIRKLISSNQ